MSELPSRDDVKANSALLRRNCWTHSIDAPLPFSSILAAYVSGRLVDREAIDPAEFAKVLIDNAGAIAAAEMIRQAAIGDTG